MKETLLDLKARRSCRKYLPQQISDQELDAILEAGTYAPTGMGMQSPVIVVVQKPELVAKLSKLNAQVMGKEIDPFYGAPCVLVVLADTHRPTYLYDGALVMGNLMTAAWSLGVGSCWINRAREFFDTEEGREVLKKWGLPETFRGVGFCVLGYIEGDVPAPRARKEGYILRP